MLDLTRLVVSGFGEKWPNSGSILKAEKSGFPHRLVMGMNSRKKEMDVVVYQDHQGEQMGGGCVEWESWVWAAGPGRRHSGDILGLRLEGLRKVSVDRAGRGPVSGPGVTSWGKPQRYLQGLI